MSISNIIDKYLQNTLTCVGVVCCLLLSSCDIINPDEAIPAYLQIDSFQLTTLVTTQGSNGHQITDVWAFVNGEPLGIFELPATIPVLAEGEQTIRLFAGIRANGLRSAPTIYPFYEPYEAILNLQAAQTTQIDPLINYSSNSIFVFTEDFESPSIGLRGTQVTDIQQTTDVVKVRTGQGAGRLRLGASDAIELTSVPIFRDLPTMANVPVYLEMDYRTNVELEVGLVGIDPNSTNLNSSVFYKVVLCPINDWNKVYINFQEDLQVSQFEGYRLAFRASKDNTGCASIGDATPEILLDNIKLIRF